MPPSLISRDSPRAQHGRRRAPRGQLARSSSLFGAIKNLVTAPLTWFTSYDEYENVVGKRGRNSNTALQDEGTYHEDQPSAKRKRVDSPEPAPPQHQRQQQQQPATRTTQGYLDVPQNLLSRQPVPRQRQNTQHGHGRSSSLAVSLSVPAVPGAHPARRTASPAGILSLAQSSTSQRTQSMDPPSYRAISLSRDVSMEDGISGSATRDTTMSPSRQTPFQLRARSSMTPQPTGQTFGPTPRRKERDVSEPPPLAALMSNPVFVKPPPQMSQTQSQQVVTTLGSLAEVSGRISRSPMRQHSGLFLGARPGSITESGSTPYGVPINAAEKALHDLDVYKTPLLPSRLRGSHTIPEMFKPRKAHAPVLMRSDRDREHKPRLGTSEKKGKEKDEETAAASKPYAGRGGMKKMLARRKLEEQEEFEKERANAIEADEDEVAVEFVRVEKSEVLGKVTEVARLPSPPPPPARQVGGREQSSLRVGRTHTSRNHIPRPMSKAKNRFSAAFDDDEGEDSMIDEAREQAIAEEPKKLPTLFESPKGFSFAPEKSPVLQDSSNAKEPPIAALPFSFTKPTVPASVPATPFSFTEPPKALAPAPASALAEQPAHKAPEVASSAQSAPSFPSVPSISFIPPSPAPAKPIAEASVPAPAAASTSTTSSIPNFFANSSIFSKPGVLTIVPPAPAPAPAAPPTAVAENKQEVKPAAPPSLFGGLPSFGQATAPKETPAPVTEPSKPTAVPPFPFATPTAAPASTPGASTPSFFSSPFVQMKETSPGQPMNPFFAAAIAAPAPTKSPAPALAPEVKPPAPASSPFSFDAPAKPAETSAAPLAPSFSFSATPTSNVTTTAAPTTFTFGMSKAEPAKVPEAKPLFGVSEPAKSSLFAPPASSPSPFGGSQASAGVEAPKPAFTFGTPSPSTIEAPRPLFPSTSSGGTGGFSFGSTAPSAPSPVTPAAKSPFSFGTAPSAPQVSTPANNKPTFTFGVSSTPSVSAPTTLFGGPSTGGHGADVSKPFAFGNGAPTRSITPPQKEQEMRMEESPTRGGGMDMNGEQPQLTLKPPGAFSFGAPSASVSSPFGQLSQSATSPFSFGAKTETKPEVKATPSFASFGQSVSTPAFAFGQKSTESTQSPISPAPFGSSAPFGQAANTPTAAASPFAFGAPTVTTTTGGFGQPSPAINSQPASPSTFGQPSTAPFAFGVTPTSATTPSNPFAFGSQPASPANGNTGLPHPPGSSGGPSFAFGATSSAAQSPSSPFGAPPSLPPTGGIGFTIGSAAPQQAAAGPRAIKKLPNRRGGRQR